MMCMELHERLRQARERQGLSLTTIAQERGVREQNLAADRAQPVRGAADRALRPHAVRAYASAVGLPADEAVGEVLTGCASRRIRSTASPACAASSGRVRVASSQVAPSVARPVQAAAARGVRRPRPSSTAVS